MSQKKRNHQTKRLKYKSQENRSSQLILEGLARGEKALLEGRIVSHTEAKKRLTRWIGE